MYKIELSKRAEKFLLSVKKSDYLLIQRVIDNLQADAYPSGVKKLKGYTNVYRARAGNYRILYRVDSGILTISVIDIGNRKNIYD